MVPGLKKNQKEEKVMLTSIRELIEREELQLEETVYRFSSDEVLEFPLTIGDFINVCEGKDAITSLLLVMNCLVGIFCSKKLWSTHS